MRYDNLPNQVKVMDCLKLLRLELTIAVKQDDFEKIKILIKMSNG